MVVIITIWSICLLLGRLSEGMRRQAGTDHLTGLLNRNGFQTAALRERALADRTGNPLTLAVIDLDGFKQINDRDGHAAGDRSAGQPRSRLARSACDQATSSRVMAAMSSCCCSLRQRAPARRHCSSACAVAPISSAGRSASASGAPGERLDAPMARADRYLYGVKSAQRGGDAEGGHGKAADGRVPRARRPAAVDLSGYRPPGICAGSSREQALDGDGLTEMEALGVVDAQRGDRRERLARRRRTRRSCACPIPGRA